MPNRRAPLTALDVVITHIMLMPTDEQRMDAEEELMKLRRHQASWLAITKANSPQEAWDILLERTGWLKAYKERRRR